MTVLGPLPINEMGVTLMHEHILLDASGKWVPPCCCSDRHLAEMPVKMENLGELSLNPLMSRDNCQLFDVDVAIEELTKYRALWRRNRGRPDQYRYWPRSESAAYRASDRSEHYYGYRPLSGAFAPEWVRTSSVEQLTERLIYDLGGRGGETGGTRRAYRRNRYLQPFTPDEEKSLRAAVGPAPRPACRSRSICRAGSGWVIGCWIFSSRKAPIYAIPCCAIHEPQLCR